MPILQLCQRQRERVIKRTWTPISPELHTASLGGQWAYKIFPKPSIKINDPIAVYDGTPFGFYFLPIPNPQFISLTPAGGIAIDPMQAALLPGLIPPLTVSGTSLVNQPGTITPAQAALQAAVGIPPPQPLLREIPFKLTPGKSSIPIYATSFLVRHITILADPANTGNIWLVSGRSIASGSGFKIIAGASIDLGHVLLTDVKLDLSTLFIVAENATDSVFIAAEA